MANQEHLQILARGVDAWNKWREEEPNAEPDLSGVEQFTTPLKGINFSGANFRDAMLVMAQLSNANFTGAKLNKASLSAAQLDGADLSDADLSGADLTNVDLSNTLLRNATLRDTVLSGANLSGADLQGSVMAGTDLGNADLLGANLAGADLSNAYLLGARLSVDSISDADIRELDFQTLDEINWNCATLHKANLSGANLAKVCLTQVNLSGANLSGANLAGANLDRANMDNANLSGANLSGASLLGTSLKGASLENCSVYGVSAWDIQLEGAEQSNLIVTDINGAVISVDDLSIAQLVYQLLKNKNIRDAIDFIAFKMVLILGHFTSRRRNVLYAIKSELRQHHYWPIFFDYQKAMTRDLAETISTLASLSHFVIVDLTELKSIPLELYPLIPFLKNIPVQPLLEEQKKEYTLFQGVNVYPWVLPAYSYKDSAGLRSSLKRDVIDPSEKKMHELERRRA